MLQTVGFITLISLIATVCTFLFRYKTIKSNFLFFIFCTVVLLNELVLFITAQFDINNHIIANVNTLTYYALSILILFHIWESIRGKNKVLNITRVGLILLLVIGWILENFVIQSISVYNSFLSSIICLVLVIISIYLINVLLFVKSNNMLKDSDGLLLIGMLIRSFACGLLFLFLNYRMKYSTEFYGNILILVNISLIISDIFFLFSIICLPKNRKYTWPF
jgi:hypothetical protein